VPEACARAQTNAAGARYMPTTHRIKHACCSRDLVCDLSRTARAGAVQRFPEIFSSEDEGAEQRPDAVRHLYSVPD
jgi:hypothetical protein